MRINLHSRIPESLEFKDGECKDIAFISTTVETDPNSPNDEQYCFYCYDIDEVPSDGLRLWKVEPKVAARIFGGFLNGHYDQHIWREGKDYFTRPTKDAKS